MTTHAERLPPAGRAAGTNETFSLGWQPLDHETQAEWNLVVAVENEEPLFSCDAGQLQRPRQASASATVSVRVTNVNDPPTFHPGTFIVSEVDGAGPGTQLGMFNATDPDRTAGQIRWGDWSGKGGSSCRISHVLERVPVQNWLLLCAPEGDSIPVGKMP